MKKIILLFLFASIAMTLEAKKLVEVQCIDIPANAKIMQGKTKTGNDKYWFEFSQIGKVTVSPGSAEKFIAGTVTLQLVKWLDEDSGEYFYTTRQKKGKKETKNIDLLTIFRN